MRKQVVGAFAISLASAGGASAQNPVGGEFLVNTYTTGRQGTPRAAMEPGGDFIVTWSSDGQDGSGQTAIGQRFHASGARRGSEFQINTYTTGSQRRPVVAVGSGGDFIAVWVSVQDGSGDGIQGQRFDASGAAIGAEFQVNSFTTGFQYRPNVARASDGRFVVSWETQNADGSFYGIAARRFDASGNPVGNDFVVNTYTTGFQRFADVAMDAAGNFVVVWQSPGDGSGAAVLGQRYDASGNRLGSDFVVNGDTVGNQAFPSISASPSGGFVVVWASAAGDGSGYGVMSRIFAASGNPVGNDFVVNTYTTGEQYGFFGQVAHDALGNFVVTWHGDGDGSDYGTFAQRFSASGVRRGPEVRMNTYTTDGQRYPSVASDSHGNFVVAWTSFQDGDDSGIFAQRHGDVIFQDGFDIAGLGR